MQKFFIIFISVLILVFGSAFSCSAVENATEVSTLVSTENSTESVTSGSTVNSTESVTSSSTVKVHSDVLNQVSSVRIFLFLIAQVVFFLLLILLLK